MVEKVSVLHSSEKPVVALHSSEKPVVAYFTISTTNT